jgi:uncharacterized protein (TIGR03086 family)
MTDLRELHRRAAQEFDRYAQAIREDDWTRPTPCEDWDVRALLNHMVAENLWVPELLAGATVADVGDRFDGDVLDDEPRAAWDESIEAALAAFEEDSALDRTVHLSFGDSPATLYASQRTTDLLIHAWDLARAIGADDTLDPALVAWCWKEGEAQEEQIRASSVFGDAVPVADDADLQTRLLALYGRRRNWPGDAPPTTYG